MTSTDDGKVLKASYSGGTGSFSWETESGGGAQADWTESDSADPSYIQNKPAVLGMAAGNNVSITETNGNIIISATDTTYSAGTGLSLSGTTMNVTVPVPAFSTSTDVGKVLTVTSNGLAWVSVASSDGEEVEFN